jgi:hypothetical protein
MDRMGYNENVFTRGEEGTPLTRLSGQEAPDYSDIQKPKIPGHPRIQTKRKFHDPRNKKKKRVVCMRQEPLDPIKLFWQIFSQRRRRAPFLFAQSSSASSSWSSSGASVSSNNGPRGG